jgi:hypothetical protein
MYHFTASQLWFATVQLVLQADWQDAWHSPQPPLASVLFSIFVLSVFISFVPLSMFFLPDKF